MIRRSFLLAVMLVAMVALAGGCASGGKKTASGKAANPDATIYIVLDRNITEDQEESHARSQGEIADWMEEDLRNILMERGGYEAKVISSKKEFEGGRDAYLLNVRIDKYNPGSTAARMLIGFGAGAASMDITYSLKDSGGKEVLKESDGVGTSGHWKRVARKLNENMLATINSNL